MSYVFWQGGIDSCLAFFDFFSAEAQRAALSVTAGCCLTLAGGEFHLVSRHLTAIASRLRHQVTAIGSRLRHQVPPAEQPLCCRQGSDDSSS